jgi:hypothetical protein
MTHKKIIFLITPAPVENAHLANLGERENHLLLPKAFEDCGWAVSCTEHESINLGPSGPEIAGVLATDYDLIWPVGFGPKNSFLDRSSLLASIHPRRLITPISALILSHGKSAWIEHCPETHISNSPDVLMRVLSSAKGTWVLKPLAGSFGRGVQIVEAGGKILEEKLVQMTLAQTPGAYFCLQRFLPDIAKGETRTLVVGGEIIGSYLRKPTDGLRANLAQFASAERTRLTAPQTALVAKIQQELVDKRIGFAAIDSVGEYLMEVNVANPGGLGTLNHLYQKDFGAAVVEAVEGFI